MGSFTQRIESRLWSPEEGTPDGEIRRVTAIMSMDYEGCCLQEESMEIQCQERGVVDYDYDDGDTIRAKFKYDRPAFAPGGIGMFVVTGRPPGRLIGG